MSDIIDLINREGWKVRPELKGGKTSFLVRTPYDDDIGPLKAKHPAFLHLDIYAKHSLPSVRFQHLKKAREYLWPDRIWHDWTRRRYEAHCENYNFISQAAGASAGKSWDWAEIAVQFFFANPLERNVTIASSTLASLKGRVWGYVTSAVQTMAVQPQYVYKSSPSPQILPVVPQDQLKASGRGKIEEDTLHGMFAVTAKQGDDDQAVATWIGKHPKEKMLVILDEGTEMPMSILNAVPNLNSHPKKFQMVVIGNSNSTMDLHGLLSTPLNGWDSVSPELIEWKTTQMNGICQYFSPYQSPAVLEEDPQRRALLEIFLIGRDNLAAKEKELGKDSEKFYRWVLGFWKSRGTESTTVSDKFLKDFSPTKQTNWSGYYPIQRVAGLDPAVSTGGDKCILRIANVGQDMDTKVKIDLAGPAGLFEIPLKAIVDKSVELQLADHVIDILIRYGVPINYLGIDVTGQGRAIGEVIRLRNEQKGYPLGYGNPLKIYSMSQHNKNKRKESVPDIVPMSMHELWNDIRSYIELDCIRNMDSTTQTQLTNRLVIRKGDRMFLETKQEYKRRMSAIGKAHSPDEADATAITIQVVKQRMGILPGTVWKVPESGRVTQHLDKMYAMMTQTMQKPAAPKTPTVNTTAGLTNYVKYTKPF